MSELIRTTAKFPGMCCICGTSIHVGEKIYQGTTCKGTTPVASREDCAVQKPEDALRIFDHDPNLGASS